MAPYFPSYAERIANLDKLLAEFTQSASLDVSDSSRTIEQTDHFADRLRLNRRGTKELTGALIEIGALDVV